MRTSSLVLTLKANKPGKNNDGLRYRWYPDGTKPHLLRRCPPAMSRLTNFCEQSEGDSRAFLGHVLSSRPVLCGCFASSL